MYNGKIIIDLPLKKAKAKIFYICRKEKEKRAKKA